MATHDTTEIATQPAMLDISAQVNDFIIQDTLDSARIEGIHMSREAFLQAQAKYASVVKAAQSNYKNRLE